MPKSQNKTFNGSDWTFFNRYHMEVFKELAYLKITNEDARIVFVDGTYFIVKVHDLYQFKKLLDRFFDATVPGFIPDESSENEINKVLEFLIYRKPFSTEKSVTTNNWIINYADKTLSENNAG